jgi:hypothetical protein
MKKLLLLILALFVFACSTDDKQIEQNSNGSKRYQKQVVNGVMTSNTRPLTDPNSYCGEITESGVIELPGVNATYYWVVVCEN